MTPEQKHENDLLDIYNLAEVDFSLDDYVPVSDSSANGDALKVILKRLLAIQQPAQGRLTLESGVPYSSSPQTAKTTLYWTPYLGCHVSIYDGTRWILFSFTELSLSLSGYTAGKNYDIWAYSNSGTLTLDSTIWTNDSTRATELAYQDGILVKSGDATRRYLGTIRITGTTGQCEDSHQRRFVWNYYNRLRQGGGTWNTNANWTYATSAWRESNNGNGHTRFEFVVGVSGEALIRHMHSGYQSGNTCNSGTCIDATNSAFCTHYIYGTSSYVGLGLRYQNWSLNFIAAGYHFATQTEYAQGVTVSYYDGNTAPYRLSQFMLEY